jgi:hypothetical protein
MEQIKHDPDYPAMLATVEHTVHPSVIHADYLVDYTIHSSLM